MLPVPQTREGIGRGVDEEARYGGQDASGGHPMNRQPLSPVERTLHRIAVDKQANRWINRPGKRRMRARRREADLRTALRGSEAAAQQIRKGGQLEGKRRGKQEQMTEKKGRWRRSGSSWPFICRKSGRMAPTRIWRGQTGSRSAPATRLQSDECHKTTHCRALDASV